MDIKTYIRKTYNTFIGSYDVTDLELIAKLLGHSTQIERPTYFKSIPAKRGAYFYKEDDHIYIVHRTTLGWFFQSTYRLKLGDPSIFEGSKQRKASGLFGIMFYVMGTIVLITLIFEGEAPLLIGSLMWVLYTALLVLNSKLEYYFILRGFKSAASRSVLKSH